MGVDVEGSQGIAMTCCLAIGQVAAAGEECLVRLLLEDLQGVAAAGEDPRVPLGTRILVAGP